MSIVTIAAKLKGVNTVYIPALTDIVCCLKIVWFEFTKIRGAKSQDKFTREVANF